MTQHINKGEQKITLTGGYWGKKYSRDNPNGFRIKKSVRDRLCKLNLKTRPNQKGVIIEFPLDKSPPLSVKVTSSFWRKCYSFRKPEIGEWMIKRKDAPWPEEEPPKYTAKLSTAGTGPIKIKVLRKK